MANKIITMTLLSSIMHINYATGNSDNQHKSHIITLVRNGNFVDRASNPVETIQQYALGNLPFYPEGAKIHGTVRSTLAAVGALVSSTLGRSGDNTLPWIKWFEKKIGTGNTNNFILYKKQLESRDTHVIFEYKYKENGTDKTNAIAVPISSFPNKVYPEHIMCISVTFHNDVKSDSDVIAVIFVYSDRTGGDNYKDLGSVINDLCPSLNVTDSRYNEIYTNLDNQLSGDKTAQQAILAKKILRSSRGKS